MDELTLHHALLRREAWPGTGGEVEFRETHASRVYLVGERVYKVKKPVDFGFLDFTTLERRIHFCREEVRLNDRFAPGTYLGVGELRADGGRIRLDGAGERVEVAVVMRRLPAERMLDRLLAAGDPGLPAAMGPLGVRLAELHATSTVCHQAPGSDRRQVRSNWEENFAQTAAFVPSLLPRAGQEGARRLVDSFFRDFGTLLEERQAAGFVRDGHGDLHSAHICLTEPLQIFDCIEFNPGFRIADTSADLAFLLMDLEFLGRRDLAATLLEAYRGGGGPDPGPERLLTFYKAYRAWVRGKVDGLLARAPAAEEAARARAAALSRRYFSLALGYFAPRQLLLTCGLMGSGKINPGPRPRPRPRRHAAALGRGAQGTGRRGRRRFGPAPLRRRDLFSGDECGDLRAAPCPGRGGAGQRLGHRRCGLYRPEPAPELSRRCRGPGVPGPHPLLPLPRGGRPPAPGPAAGSKATISPTGGRHSMPGRLRPSLRRGRRNRALRSTRPGMSTIMFNSLSVACSVAGTRADRPPPRRPFPLSCGIQQ